MWTCRDEGESVNPFRDTIVASPWETTRVDVPAIHGRIFDECLSGVERVRQSGHSAGLLIHGEAGSGKTHLLSRLRARLAPQAPSDTHRPESLFVWVRLQTSPRMIWRAVRRTLVDDWFRPIAGMRSQFQRILFHRLAEIRPAIGDLERWYEYMLDENPGDLKSLVEEIATNLDLDRNTTVAFTHIAFERHLRDLRAWLAGASLPQAALERIDLTQDETNDEEREAEARQIVLMLCRLAGNGLPVVLSFDQVEALQISRGDREALYAFGQLVSTLHDGTTNVLLVSCVQSAFAADLKAADAREADYDRIKSFGSLSLDPLNREQAEQLIGARLSHAGQSPRAESRSTCWPLEPGELDELLSDTKAFVSPRRLLTVCAERYETRVDRAGAHAAVAAEPTAPESFEETVTAFLENQWTACVEQKLEASSPERTEEIVRHGLPMLIQLAAPGRMLVHDDLLPDVPILVEGSRGRSGVAVCADANMKTRAAQLRRLKVQFARDRLARLVLLCDPRVPLSQGARAARQYQDDLVEKRAEILHPSPEALAALDALRELLSDAKSGDLPYRGQAVSPQTLAEWLTANLPAELSDLVDDVLGESAESAATSRSDAQAIETLSALLMQNPLFPLEEAAKNLEKPVDQVAALVRRHPDLFGLLGQPPTMLFRPVDRAESSA
jgi:hypothetical protein